MTNVLRYYGENPELVEKYRQIEKNGKCPFCPDGIIDNEFQIVGKTPDWTLVVSQFPYKGAEVHLFILPKRHVISSTDLMFFEWADWPEILEIAVNKYPLLKKGFGLAMREKTLGGVTLHHLHFHLIVPKANSEGGAEIPVNFGIG
ncbi:MAG: HIT family protein [Candidatus Wildermuthbacteria bacterium]|nr:HIT family protein [Candidatus Wildermuthbacteria bacterium]